MSNSEIHLISGDTLNDYENFKWSIGNSYTIEFFENIITPLNFLNQNCNIHEFIHALPSSDDIIFIDFVYLISNQSNTQNIEQNLIPKNFLFTFCYKTSIYIFLQTESNVNDQIKEFLTSETGLRFVGINSQLIKEQLNDLFGSEFSINLEDFTEIYLSSYEEPRSFNEIINKYIGQPKLEIDINQTVQKFDIENSIIPQVIISGFKVLSLSLLYLIIPQLGYTQELPTPEKTIQFTENLTADDFDSDWKVGESYTIEFFKGIFTPVYLIDSNSDLTKYLQKISKDPIIYLDLKTVQSYVYKAKLTPEEQKEVPYVCLFSFSCSFGVFIFKQLTLTANEQMKAYLMIAQKDHKFVGINLEASLNKLNHFFGPNFSLKIEDVSKSRLTQKTDPTNFYDLVVKYFKQPETEFRDKKVKNVLWHKDPLTITHIIYSAFKIFSLSICYQNFPPEKVDQGEIEVKHPILEKPKKQADSIPPSKTVSYKTISPSEVKSQPEINKKGEIHFASIPNLNVFQKMDWAVGDSYDVEFFADSMTTVYLLDSCSDISEYVKKMASETVIFFDLEYVMQDGLAPPICLFQFCVSSGAFLFKQTLNEVNDQMRNFLAFQGGNKFVGKGVNGDIQRLKLFFGENFEINLEDVEQTRLYSYGETANFDEMVMKYAGKPESNFKDKKISRSNWNVETFSIKQVLYAAFDVVSLRKCFPAFPPIRAIRYDPPGDTVTVNVKKKFEEYLKENKGVDDEIEFNSIWNLNPNLVVNVLQIDLDVLDRVVHRSMKVTTGHRFSCKLCQKPVKCNYFISLINHYLKKHISENVENFDVSKKIDFKDLFFDYLFNSGRIVVGNFSCILCDLCFDSEDELKNHCWNSHYDILNEFLKLKKNQNCNNSNSNDKDDEISE